MTRERRTFRFLLRESTRKLRKTFRAVHKVYEYAPGAVAPYCPPVTEKERKILPPEKRENPVLQFRNMRARMEEARGSYTVPPGLREAECANLARHLNGNLDGLRQVFAASREAPAVFAAAREGLAEVFAAERRGHPIRFPRALRRARGRLFRRVGGDWTFETDLHDKTPEAKARRCLAYLLGQILLYVEARAAFPPAELPALRIGICMKPRRRRGRYAGRERPHPCERAYLVNRSHAANACESCRKTARLNARRRHANDGQASRPTRRHRERSLLRSSQ